MLSRLACLLACECLPILRDGPIQRFGGLRGLTGISLDHLWQIAGIPRIHCPDRKGIQIGEGRFHLPARRYDFTQAVEVVREGKFDFEEYQHSLKGLFGSLLRQKTHLTGIMVRIAQQGVGSIQIRACIDQPPC